MTDRYRIYFIELYKETKSYNFNDVLRNLKGYKKWAYITHNQDTKEDGSLKKEHVHFLLHLDNASTIKALSKKTGVPEQFLQNVRNERSVVRYLTHIDDEDKFQYNIEDIKSSRMFQRYVSKCFDDLETEDVILSNIFSYIDSLLIDTHVYSKILYCLLQYINLNCYDTIYKRYRYEFQDYIKYNI